MNENEMLERFIFKKVNMKLLKAILVISILSTCNFANAQDNKVKLSLSEVIEIATTQSPESFLTRHKFRAYYWRYRTHLANYLPSLSLSATLPSFERSISKITLPGGEDAFVERRLSTSSANLSIEKNLGFTGGKFFLNTNLDRIDLYGDSTVTSYLSSPFSIGIIQPVFSYNSLKWDKKIEPMVYQESQKNYLLDIENISIRAIRYFFNLAQSQLNVQISLVNFNNNDTLYQIAKGRYNMGIIARNELLQMELSLLNSDAAVNDAELDLKMKKFKLTSFLGLASNTDIEIIVPSNIPDLKIDFEKALLYAKKNNPELLALSINLIEAERDVQKAKLENTFNADIYASFGLTQSAFNLTDAYNKPQDQQRVSFGLNVPIIDWGLGKGKYKMALSNQNVTQITVEQEIIDFEQNLFLKVMQFNMQEKQLLIAAKSDTIAQNRYNVIKQRFLLGKISVTDLNIALTEKDEAMRKYYNSLFNYWNYFYDLRKLTLFDFESDKELIFNIEEIIE